MQSMNLVESFEEGFKKLEKVTADGTAMKHFKLMLKMQGVKDETIDKLCSFTGFGKYFDISFLTRSGNARNSFITVERKSKLPLEQTEVVTYLLTEQAGYLIDMDALTLV